MENYIRYCHSNLPNLNQFKHITIVIGNESCDLDSAISALVLAYVKHHENNIINNNNNETPPPPSTTRHNSITLPLLNVTREDLPLRREIVFWFEQVMQFDLRLLICRDEIDFGALNETGSTRKISVSLVDHNENKEIARLLPCALFDEIIDHHQPTYIEDSGCQVKDSNKVLIDTTVGSCSSLVALRFLDCNHVSDFVEGQRTIGSDSQIALLLYGPILLDTICFNHSIKRFNVKDYEAVNRLEDLLKHTADAESSLFDRNEVYQRLVDAKNSFSDLTFNELLRKDMKIVESLSDTNLAICISSITGTQLTELSLKENLNELRYFCENPPVSAIFSESRPRLFNALILLSMDNRILNNYRRQLALYCTNKHLMRTIATCIERSSELELELITASETLRVYNQNNLKATRKMVLPIISTILNGPGSQQQRSNDATDVRSPAKRPITTTTTPSRQPLVIATAEVDPEYLLTFRSKTISVPEFEEFIRCNNATSNNNTDVESTKLVPSLVNHFEEVEEDDVVMMTTTTTTTTATADGGYCEQHHSPENGKLIATDPTQQQQQHPSAPNSLIQQPDSYYGSYIEDSFVGDFVGDYIDTTNGGGGNENILVMDADGKNLLMINPNEPVGMSHTHEIEFEFDSFGPESIIYAGNDEAINNSNNNANANNIEEKNVTTSGATTNGTTTTNSNDQSISEELSKIEESTSDDDDKLNDNNTSSNGVTLPNDQSSSSIVVDELTNLSSQTNDLEQEKKKQKQSESNINNDNSDVANGGQHPNSNELQQQSDSTMAINTSIIVHQEQSVNGIDDDESKLVENVDHQLQQQLQTPSSNETTNESQSSDLPSSSTNLLGGTFSRNSTLTRSQRKKVSPQLNIKNLIMASETYSPPVLDSALVPHPPLPSSSLASSSSSSAAAATTEGSGPGLLNEMQNQSETFIISSLAQQQQQASDTSLVVNNGSSLVPNDPTSHDNPLSSEFNALNPNVLSKGLTRQPSMKKKVPVNYDVLLHSNYDKDEDGDKLVVVTTTTTTTTGTENDDATNTTNTVVIQNSIIGGGQQANEHNGGGPEHAVGTSSSIPSSNGDVLAIGIDMKVIEPYKKVISHGGYMHAAADGRNIEGASPAIIIFSACYLPDRSRRDYHYVMDHLFKYVLNTLHEMIADDYLLIYLHNGGNVQNGGGQTVNGNNMPTFGWLKRCYQMIDRKLKKNLKGLYLVHPTFWLKTLIIMSKPFISSKFSRKLKFVRSLDELRSMIPIEHVAIPDAVKM